jgi:hypothetical protein
MLLSLPSVIDVSLPTKFVVSIAWQAHCHSAKTLALCKRRNSEKSNKINLCLCEKAFFMNINNGFCCLNSCPFSKDLKLDKNTINEQN